MYEYKPLSKEEREELLKAYEDLRVTDVRDAMDWHMMHPYGTMAPNIRPLFRTRIFGIARTARYLPFVGPVPWNDLENYPEWAG